MNSKKLVTKVFEGEEGIVPLHVESDSKEEEAILGDVVGVGAKIIEWREFYKRGGPFAREPHERLSSWADRIEVEEYEWPEVNEVITRAVKGFDREARRYSKSKFILYKVLGPTETSESFFTRGVSETYAKLHQIAHEFGFATLLLLNPKKACMLFDKISEYILELVKVGTEIDYVDAIRIADDIATYGRLLYPQWFIKEYHLKWHREYCKTIKKNGKYSILHCDGNILLEPAKSLTQIYDGIHPLDLRPRFSIEDAYKWIDAIIKARTVIGDKTIFFTGIPIELLFNNNINIEDICDIVKKLLNKHGKRKLVLATTHSNYPNRSYKEPLVMDKLEAINKMRVK